MHLQKELITCHLFKYLGKLKGDPMCLKKTEVGQEGFLVEDLLPTIIAIVQTFNFEYICKTVFLKSVYCPGRI